MNETHTLRASAVAYAVGCGVLFLPLLVMALSSGGLNWVTLLSTLALPVGGALWLASFRLLLDESGLEVRQPFRRNLKVAYSEIASLK